MQEMSVRPSVSKSVYVFLGISMLSTGIVLAAGLLIVVNLHKVITLSTTLANSIYVAPLLIGCVGLLFGLFAKFISRNNEESPEDGCAANVAVLFNIVVPVIYVVFLMIVGAAVSND